MTDCPRHGFAPAYFVYMDDGQPRTAEVCSAFGSPENADKLRRLTASIPTVTVDQLKAWWDEKGIRTSWHDLA